MELDRVYQDVELDKDTPILRDKNFRWLASGGVLSSLGDQLTIVAIPWLVLLYTSESWVLGVVIFLMGFPRAAFILIGGAIVDRFSPKLVMLCAKFINGVVLLLLSYFTANGALTNIALFGFAFVLGVSGAFAIPSRNAILPLVVGRDRLEKANGFLTLIGQIALIFGPLLASFVLGYNFYELSGRVPEGAFALALLLGLDALTYFFSMLTLSLVSCPKTNFSQKFHLVDSILQGFRVFWANLSLRMLVFYVAASSCVVGGMLQIGLPLLIKNSFLGGGEEYGYMLAISAIGTSFGVLLSILSNRVSFVSLGVALLVADILVGMFVIVLGLSDKIIVVFGIIFVMGVCGGFVHVGMISWVQRQIDPELLGRVMSIIMFVAVGLVPVSAVLFGFIVEYLGLSNLFVFVGLFLSLLALLGLSSKNLRGIKRGS